MEPKGQTRRKAGTQSRGSHLLSMMLGIAWLPSWQPFLLGKYLNRYQMTINQIKFLLDKVVAWIILDVRAVELVGKPVPRMVRVSAGSSQRSVLGWTARRGRKATGLLARSC